MQQLAIQQLMLKLNILMQIFLDYLKLFLKIT